MSLALVAAGHGFGEGPKAAAADPYKVLVVTSTQDALSTAGITAITTPSAATAP